MDPNDLRDRVEEAIKDEMTGWEYEFLYGIRDLAELSQKQTAVLDRIYRRARR